MPGSPFAITCGRESAYIGKKFVMKLLEELNVIGYDAVTSMDLSRAFDQGTLVFKQNLLSGERIRYVAYFDVSAGGGLTFQF